MRLSPQQRKLSKEYWETFAYFTFKTALKDFLAQNLGIRGMKGVEVMTAGTSVFAGVGASVANSIATKVASKAAKVHFFDSSKEVDQRLIVKALCSGVMYNLVPLILPGGAPGLAAYFVLYTAGRTVIDVALSSRYDSSKSFLENFKEIGHRHLPVFYSLDFLSELAFPIITGPVLGLSTGLSDNILFKSAVKSLYYTTVYNAIITPLSKEITDRVTYNFTKSQDEVLDRSEAMIKAK